MADFQNWIENHAGLISFQGNLAGIAQRNQLLASQNQQNALLREKLSLERERASHEAHLEARQNLLYEIHQHATDISGRLESGSAQAYYELLLLNELIGQLNFDHRSFRSLEWKNFCTEALNFAQQLFGRARIVLGEETCQQVEQYRASELEREQFERERQARLKTEAARLEERQRRRGNLIIFGVLSLIGAGIAVFCTISYTYSDYRFIHSVRDGDSDTVKYLLKHGKSPTFQLAGDPILAVAIRDSSNDEVARALIQSGADVNALDNKGNPILCDLIASGHANRNECLVLTILLNQGAAVNATDKDGRSPLILAAEDKDDDYAPVLHALIDGGADVNAVNKEGQTALYAFISAGNAAQNDCEALSFLIAHGADVNACDKKGHTPLSAALKRLNDWPDAAYNPVVSLLKKQGAKEADSDASPPSSPNTQPTQVAVNDAFSGSADQLFQEYDANKANADNLYKKRPATISGEITNIGKDIMLGTPYIVVGGKGALDEGVQCFFNPNNNPIASLSKGQSVTVHGTVDGRLDSEVGSVMLENCTLR